MNIHFAACSCALPRPLHSLSLPPPLRGRAGEGGGRESERLP